jgi:hypothetical protein
MRVYKVRMLGWIFEAISVAVTFALFAACASFPVMMLVLLFDSRSRQLLSHGPALSALMAVFFALSIPVAAFGVIFCRVLIRSLGGLLRLFRGTVEINEESLTLSARGHVIRHRWQDLMKTRRTSSQVGLWFGEGRARTIVELSRLLVGKACIEELGRQVSVLPVRQPQDDPKIGEEREQS